jgi:hypothetical protein
MRAMPIRTQADNVSRRRVARPALHNTALTLSRSACACGGGCPRCQQDSVRPISEPGDVFEREADRVAESTVGASEKGGAAHITAAPISISRAAAPMIQRQAAGAQSSGAAQQVGAPAQTAGTPRQYVDLICEIIADIRRAVEQGRVWSFEDEVRLGGDEMVGSAGLPTTQHPLIDERRTMLIEVVNTLDVLAQRIESGAQPLSEPASRLAVSRLWWGNNPRRNEFRVAPPGHPARWTTPTRWERIRGQNRPVFPTRAHYIAFAASTTPRLLQPRPFPTWWIESCGPREQPEPPPANPRTHTPEPCPANSTVTTRQVVLAPPPRHPYVFDSSGSNPFEEADDAGRVFEERRDARGEFVCRVGERINRSW